MNTQEAVDLWLARFGTRWTTAEETDEILFNSVFWYSVFKTIQMSRHIATTSATHKLESAEIIRPNGLKIVYRLKERNHADR